MSESIVRRAWRVTVTVGATVFCLGVVVGVAGSQAVEGPPASGTTVPAAVEVEDCAP